MNKKSTFSGSSFYRLNTDSYYRQVISQDLIYKQNYHNIITNCLKLKNWLLTLLVHLL